MRFLVAAALTLTFAALAAGPARADLVVDGHGWGHGVGLSQYGAYGYALLEGRDHAWILRHYYDGTSLGTARNRTVRVLLRRTRQPRLCGLSGARAANGRRIRLNESHVYVLKAISRGRVRVVDASRHNRRRARLVPPVSFTGGSSWCLRGLAQNGLRDGDYRGRAVVQPDGRALFVVNAVGLESYLRGVVAAEMPSAWPAAALQAQAVIARSYALRGLRPASPYDVYADTRSQMYGGIDREAPSTTAAVRATRGQVVVSGGQVAQTFFFSTSGGRTASNDEVWGGSPISYLRSVPDPHDALSPYHDWTARFSDAAAKGKLRSLGIGAPQKLAVVARTPSGRAAAVEVDGRTASVTLPASQLAALLGLRSTWFSVTESPADRPN